jgi:hypothetical protein
MSTYSTNLALELIGTGEQAGVWGTTTNTNLGTLIEQSISGYVTQAVATGTDTTITIPNGSSGVARNMYIELTGTGGASTNLIVPANKKLYFIFNNSTGAVTVKVSGQTGVSVPTGKKMVLVSNGTDIVNGINYIADFASNSATITHLSATSASITNLTLTSLVISNLSIASANITTLTGSTQTLSGNLTLNGGTANGVLYLNGSKVATSGSALTFDGTNLGIGGSPSFYQGSGLLISRSGYATIRLNDSSGGGTAAEIKQSDSAGLILESISNRPIQFNVNASEQMRLTSTGLGIGTSSPAYKLDVTGTSTTALSAAGFTNNSSANNTTKTVGITFRLADTVGVIKDSAYITAFPDGANVLSAGVAFSTRTGDANPTEKMRLDSSGNLGLGVTPTNNTLGKSIQNGQASAWVSETGSNRFWLASNWKYDGSDKYLNNGFATLYSQQSGQHQWLTAASGTAGNTISFTQAMTLDASGNLLVGTTSATYGSSGRGLIEVNGSDQAFLGFKTGGTGRGYVSHIPPDMSIWNSDNGYLRFATNNTERARITSGGDLLVGTTNTSATAGEGFKSVFPIAAVPSVRSVGNNSTSSYSTYEVYSTSAAAYRFYVDYAGTVFATTTTISAISDQRFKENVQDIDVGLNAVMALKPRKFDWKAGKGKDIKGDRGFIAQEFEQVFPDLIDEWKDPAPEGEEPYKSVRQDLIPVLVKAIQELTARVAQLESK